MGTLTPRLEIYTSRIQANAKSVIALCKKHGIDVACVTKGASAHPALARALAAAAPYMIADSRLPNLASIYDNGIRLPRLLLRMPAPSDAEAVVHNSEISLNTSLLTLTKLSDAAIAANKKHQVIIMIDVGDLREGVWPSEAPSFVKKAAKLKGLDIIGLGCNLACFGGVIPSVQNMKTLIEVSDICRKDSGLELKLLSGGNSANLPLLASGKMPKAINHLRIGESIILGRNALDRSPWQGTRQDTFVAVASVIEVAKKPSMPIGDRGQDAFGGTSDFEDRGKRVRAICALGRQDTAIDGLFPMDEGIEVLGGSSDHLILDIEDAKRDIKVGDEISFTLSYGALLALSTSPYVRKVAINDN